MIFEPGPCPAHGPGTAVTIGAYDGVHLGHRQVIDRVKEVASSRGLASGVVTFDRHPAQVVRPEAAPKLLCDLDQKLERLESTGVDRTAVVRFDHERASESAESFVRRVLVGCLGARAVVVGEDFHFGHARAGNVALLESMGKEEGFEVEGLPLFADHGQPISSTRIRRLVEEGDVAAAAALLGQPHELAGVVVHGDGRGAAQLGFPTANVAVPTGMAVPAPGIYAGRYTAAGGRVYDAAISLGVRPTFHESAPLLLEAHLLDFAGDLYGERARVGFVARLRPEMKFGTVADLVRQIGLDVEATRAVLGER